MYPPFGPIIVQLGPLALRWYSLTMTAAIFLGTYVASRYMGNPASGEVTPLGSDDGR